MAYSEADGVGEKMKEKKRKATREFFAIAMNVRGAIRGAQGGILPPLPAKEDKPHSHPHFAR